MSYHLTILVRSKLIFDRITKLYPFSLKCKNPMPIQWNFLKTLLQKNQNTEFGEKYGFSRIQTIADFQARVPIHAWNDMAPYIGDVIKGIKTVLFPTEEQIIMFAKTSGTTGEPKFIPVTETSYLHYKKYWDHSWASKDNAPWCPDGKILYFPGDPEEGYIGTIPFGAITAKAYAQQNKLLRILYPYPYQVCRIKNYELRYYTIMRLALENRVTVIAIANPSTILKLFNTAKTNAEKIIQDIREGKLRDENEMPKEFVFAVKKKLKPNPKRARELVKILSETRNFLPRDYWNNPISVYCFASGPLKLYLNQLKNYHERLYLYDFGLLASEGRFSFSLGTINKYPGCCLTIESNFFEFIPEEQIEEPNPQALTLDQVEKGKRYFIIVTNYSGLYRYNISDVVEVTGFLEKVPLITFCHKGKHFSNITGEKLSEFQVTESVRRAEEKFGYHCGDFVVCLHWNEETPSYSLLKEPNSRDNPAILKNFIDSVEGELAILNVEYLSKRQSLRLGPLTLKIVQKDSLKDYIANKQRLTSNLSQYKQVYLINDPEFEKQFPIKNEISSSMRF